MVSRIAKRAILPVIFIAVSLALAGILLYNLLYTNAFVVMVNDEVWGYVENTDDIDEQVQEIEAEVGEIRNEDYTLKVDVEYEPAVVLNSTLSASDDIRDYLYDTVDDITDNYVLTIDGETIGMGDYSELSKMTEDIKQSYVNENTISAEILTDYDIDYETIPSETDDDINNISESLISTKQAPVVYLTQENDTLENILEKENLTETQFFTLNPQLEKITNEDGETIVTLKVEPEEDTEESNPQTEDIDETEDIESEDDIEDTEDEEISERAIETYDLPEEMSEIEEDETIDEFEDNIEDTRITISEEEVYGPDYQDILSASDEETEDADLEETDAEIIEDEESMEETEEEVIETPIDSDIEILVSPEKSCLVVETHEATSYERAIEYETEIIETDELYEGEQQTVTLGKNGTLIVYEESVYQNGTKIDQFETNREIEDPVNEVVMVGTKVLDPSIGQPVEEEEVSVETVIEGAQQGVYYAYNYIWPLSNYGTSSISSGFGWRVLNGSSEYHQGIDISAPNGTPIMASKAGTVITNTYNSGRGWYVQIDHGDGYITTYQHMNTQSSVVVGTQVQQGQVIGYVGNTGYSFGNHLHFEAWVNTGNGYEAINPMNLFNSSTNYVVVSTENNNTSEETSDSVQALREEIVEYAKQYVGCPYVHAGHGPDVFDCSGFVGYVYRHFGYDMPYYVEGELAVGTPVSCDVSEMEPGDIIFFATTGTGEATHVGIYIGNGQYIHASSTYGVVQIATAQSTANRPIVAVRRVVD